MSISLGNKFVFNKPLFKTVRLIIDGGFSNRATDFINKAGSDVSKYIEPSYARNFLSSVMSLILIPTKMLDKGAQKLAHRFPSSKVVQKLNNFPLFTLQRNLLEKSQAQRIIRGIYEKVPNIPMGDNKNIFEGILKVLNANAGDGIAKYNTRDVEGLKRLVTGIFPIAFLMRDTYSISKKNGKTEEEAKEAANIKKKQELISAIGESAGQFFANGTLASYINNSQYGAPIINTGIGTGFNIYSRIKTGRSLIPISEKKMREEFEKNGLKNADSMKKYVSYIKKKNAIENTEPKEKKEHLLSFKNILKAAAVSIAIGFGIRFGKNKLAAYLTNPDNSAKSLTKFYKKCYDKCTNLTMKKIEANATELPTFMRTLGTQVDKKTIIELQKTIATDTLGTEARRRGDEGVKYLLGWQDKFVKIPHTNIELSVKKLIQTPLIPFKMIFELLKYPYKITEKILVQKGVIKEAAKLPGVAKDPYNIGNFFVKWQKINAQQGITRAGADAEFIKFFDDNFIRTFDLERFSKVDNTKIGQLTSILGTIGSIYFASNDDRNQTLQETGDMEKAHKDMRKRGVQRFTRIIVQLSLVNWFNETFSKHYNNSLLWAIGITSVCTLCVDNLTRFLLGQPRKTMNEAELKEFEAKKQKGLRGKMNNAIEKLTD